MEWLNNPVNQLSERAQQQGISLPTYDFVRYGERVHEHRFVCRCQFNGVTLSSEAHLSKEVAKREVAVAQLTRISNGAQRSPEEAVADGAELLENHRLKDAALLKWAWTPKHVLPHPSHQAFQLLADAVTRACLALILCDSYPNWEVAQYTRAISRLLLENTRSRIAERIRLPELIAKLFEVRTLSQAALADMLNKTLTCIFLESPSSAVSSARAWFRTTLELIETVENEGVIVQKPEAFVATSSHNYVGILKEHLEKEYSRTPTYEVVSQLGPSHALEFEIMCHAAGYVGFGEGQSKKEAKQKSASSVLEQMGIHPDMEFLRLSSSEAVKEQISRKSFLVPAILEKTLGISIEVESLPLFEQALTHNSYDSVFNYQKLEFLGDAVLRLIVTQHLLERYSETAIHPDRSSSQEWNRDTYGITCIANALDQLVSESVQARVAEEIKIETLLRVQRDAISPSVLGDVVEALIGALVLSQRQKADFFKLSSIVLSWWNKINISMIIESCLEKHMSNEVADPNPQLHTPPSESDLLGAFEVEVEVEEVISLGDELTLDTAEKPSKFRPLTAWDCQERLKKLRAELKKTPLLLAKKPNPALHKQAQEPIQRNHPLESESTAAGPRQPTLGDFIKPTRARPSKKPPKKS